GVAGRGPDDEGGAGPERFGQVRRVLDHHRARVLAQEFLKGGRPVLGRARGLRPLVVRPLPRCTPQLQVSLVPALEEGREDVIGYRPGGVHRLPLPRCGWLKRLKLTCVSCDLPHEYSSRDSVASGIPALAPGRLWGHPGPRGYLWGVPGNALNP